MFNLLQKNKFFLLEYHIILEDFINVKSLKCLSKIICKNIQFSFQTFVESPYFLS